MLYGDPATTQSPAGEFSDVRNSAGPYEKNALRRTKMPLSMEVGLGPGDFVFDRDPALPRKKGTAPPYFWPMSRPLLCPVPTAGWIKMPLGTEVDLGPCHIVLNGDPATTP